MPGMPTPQCLRRLQKEISALSKEKDSFFFTAPSPSTILVWYFILKGPENTPYEGGYYFGKLKFLPDYPMKPPEILLLTPNGRFNTNTAICLTMSSYHPEQWSPLWGVRTILTGLLSFMIEEEPTTGGMKCSDEQRRKYARESRRFNVEQMAMYKEVFPEEYAKDVEWLRCEEKKGEKSVGGLDGSFAGNSENARPLGTRAAQVGTAWRGLFPALVGLFVVAVGIYFLR